MASSNPLSSRKKQTLTNDFVRKLQARGKMYDVRDGDQKGFYVRIYPSGVKTYRCEYQRGKHYVIGRANEMSADKARGKAASIKGDVKLGIINDPVAADKRRRAEEEQKRSERITFKDFLQHRYKEYYEVTYPKTVGAAIKNLQRNFLDVFGHLTLDQITESRIINWRIKRQKETRTLVVQGKKVRQKITPATINRNIEQLSALLNVAVKFEYLKENPAAKIEKLSTEKNKTRFLSNQEYQRLLKALDEREKQKLVAREHANKWRKERGYDLYPDFKKFTYVDHLKPMVLLALGSGIRFGSLIKLEWDKHIDFSHGNIIINLSADIVKVGMAYDVPLDAETSKALKLWYEQTELNHQGKGWVFPGKKTGSHITTVKKSWKKLKEDAGIENFTWHDQRHDFASQHVMSGTDLYTVMALLGHSDPKTTKKYAHLAREHKIKAAQKLAIRRDEMRKK